MDRSDNAIQELCISYSAYMRAISEQNDKAIVTWAICLIADQERTGVTMVPVDRLRNTIKLRTAILADLY